MEWLDPPWRFWHPEPGEPFELRVRRFEVGLATREIDDPPYQIVRPTIRFHLPPGEGPDGGDYVDFTNRGLILRVLAITGEELRRAGEAPPEELIAAVEAWDPGTDRPVVFRMVRHGRGLDTQYEVKVEAV